MTKHFRTPELKCEPEPMETIYGYEYGVLRADGSCPDCPNKYSRALELGRCPDCDARNPGWRD